MRPKEDLFLLIKALNKTEKRYIKVNCDTFSREKGYLRLLTIIDKMTEYQDDILKEETGEVSHLSARKKYLFNSILKSLRTYNSEKNIGYILNGYYADINYLFEKGLHLQCEKKIDRAKKLAYLFEEYLILIQLLLVERKLLKFKNSDKLKDSIKKLSEEKNHALHLVNTETALNDLNDQMILILKKSPSSVERERKREATYLIKNSLLKNHDKFISFTSKRFYYSIRALYFEIHKNKTEATYWFKKATKLWEDKPQMITKDPDNYKTDIYNYLSNCFSVQDFDDFLPHLLRAKKIPSKSSEENAMDFQNFAFLELLYYMNVGDFDKAIDIVPEINRGIRTYSSMMNEPRLLSFYYNLTILFFIVGDYKNALKWSEKIFRKKMDSRKDIQHFVRLLQLVIHYEYSEPSVVEYVYGSSHRYFSSKGLLTSFEDLVFKLIRKANSTLDKKEKINFFAAFIEELKALNEHPLGSEELLIWAKSKISKKSIKEIMKEKIEAAHQINSTYAKV